MRPLVGTALPALLFVSAVATATLAAIAWRARERPGAVPFAGLMVAVTVWSGSYLVELTVHPGGPLLWERIQWFGIAFVPVWFLLFALDYLSSEHVSGPLVAALSVVPVATVALVWLAPDLIWQMQEVNQTAGVTVVAQEFAIWYWINLVYAYGLIAVGSYLLVRLAVVSDQLYLDQSLLLFVGVVVPLVGNAVSVLAGTPIEGIDLTPFAFTVTGLAFGNALFRYRLFELAPATWQIGQETVVGNLDDAVVITDTDGTVVYCNETAEATFEVRVDDVVGTPVRSLVGVDDVDFTAPDAMGEVDLDDNTYEVRASEIVDRHDRHLGHALVFNDITDRKRREETLERQRDRLVALERLNGVVRGVNQELVDADSREAITTAVCESLADSDLYDAAWLVDEAVPETQELESAPESVADGGAVETEFDSARSAVDRMGSDGDVVVEGGADPADAGRCLSVPVVYGKTVYGALVLFTTREDAFGERELAILEELGASVGHAVNAAEKERLLVADATIELEFDVSEVDAVLPAASATADCTLSVAGAVVRQDGDLVAYVRADGADGETVREALLADDRVADARLVADRAETVVESTLTDGSVLFPLQEYGATLESARVETGAGTVTVTVAPDADVRTVVTRVERDYPGAELTAKRRREGPLAESGEEDDLALTSELTDRQLETLETAYAAGYFEWPRDSTAEEVADSMDISAPTLHSHLRKAQNRVLEQVLADDQAALESGERG